MELMSVNIYTAVLYMTILYDSCHALAYDDRTPCTPQSSIVVFAIYPKDAVLPHSAFLRPSFLMFVFQAFHDLLG
jgi:hypothetical protein